ncbi:dihydropteroate synthase [Lachnospiraceae bacterium ZAX-1]
MQIGNQIFDVKSHTYIMGILNRTPDSFSDGGEFFNADVALYRVQDMIKEGAHIIDIGGESTRPGHEQITEQEEIERTAPIISLVKSRFDIPISIDTYKANVASQALRAGADLVNDIWALAYDANMANLIAKTGCACCLMHNRNHLDDTNFLEGMKSDLQNSIDIAVDAGIREDNIILDPGVGFGKTYEQNLEAISCCEQLHTWRYPLLLGTSRKSVIGLALDLPVKERLEGTLVTTVIAVMKRCAFVRVHDIKENARAIRMAEAIRDDWKK